MSSSKSRKRVPDDEGAAVPEKPNKATKVVHPFFLKPSEKPLTAFVWQKKIGGTCLYGIHLNPVPSAKVAAFDLDGTLIKTSSGNRFPKDKDDWMWWRSDVKKKLKSLHEEGYTIVILSNQGSAKKKTIDEWQLKIPSIAAQISTIPFRIFAATGRDIYRKPMPGMWFEFETLNTVPIDKKASFYVGDAAGRSGDHGDGDRKLALNVGLPFFTPEEYFLGSQPIPYKLKGFDPSAHSNDVLLFTPTSTPLARPSNPLKPDVILFVGYPASGKSSFYRQYLEPAGYRHVNQDKLKTKTKCVKAVENYLKSGVNCVVDNTNRDRDTRQEYIDLCKKLGTTIRCFHFAASLELCWHNNLYRAFLYKPSDSLKEPERSVLPVMAFTSFRANYEKPTLDEGFDEIKRVNFRFDGTEEDRRKWDMWLEIDSIDWMKGT